MNNQSQKDDKDRHTDGKGSTDKYAAADVMLRLTQDKAFRHELIGLLAELELSLTPMNKEYPKHKA